MSSWPLAIRRTLLAVGAAAAASAVLAGLARVGVGTAWTSMHAANHGALFVVGVFGTVISLERAVVFGRAWAMTIPALHAVTALALLAGTAVAPWLAFASALGLVVLNAALVRLRPAAFGRFIWLGSGVLLLANILWASGRSVPSFVAAWIAFPVLTIAAERLRWSRADVPPGWAGQAITPIVAGCAGSAVAHVIGVAAADRALGAALTLLATWQLRFDISRHAHRERGLSRFVGLGVQAGAAWLLVAGALLMRHGLATAGPVYDAALHAVFVGHVFGAVFAHAPTMLDSVAGFRVPFSAALYVPVLLLHLSLLARVAGDLGHSLPLRRIGSIGNAASLVAFAAMIASATLAAQRGPRRTSA